MDTVLTFFSTSADIGPAALIIAASITLVVLVVRRSGAAGPFVSEPPPAPAPESTQVKALETNSSQPPETRIGPANKSVSVLSTQPEKVEETAETDALIEVPESLPSRMQRLRSRLLGSGSLGRTIVQILSRDGLKATDWEEIENTLLIADLGFNAIDELMSRMKERVAIAGASDSSTIYTFLVKELLTLVDEDLNQSLHLDKQNRNGELPATILMVNVNETGKTTTVGRLARVLVAEGKDVLLGAANTFHVATTGQFNTWDEYVGVDVIKSDREGADPAVVAFDAVKQGVMRAVDIVLTDTAGRLQAKPTLMEELGKVKRVMEKQVPISEVLLVPDATTGQNGLKQAQTSAEAVGVMGVVLTKLDGSAKGGIVVSVQKTPGVPVKFVGLDEEAGDLAPLDLRSFISAIVNS